MRVGCYVWAASFLMLFLATFQVVSGKRGNVFDLEQSIAAWRQQMLDAGIQTPVPLEELEIHLREDVEERMRSGVAGQQAFETTVRQSAGRNVAA